MAATKCRSCKWLRVAPDPSGRIVPRRHSVYPCDAPTPEIPPLPLSAMLPPVRRRYMNPEDGAECPAHEPRTGDAERSTLDPLL